MSKPWNKIVVMGRFYYWIIGAPFTSLQVRQGDDEGNMDCRIINDVVPLSFPLYDLNESYVYNRIRHWQENVDRKDWW